MGDCLLQVELIWRLVGLKLHVNAKHRVCRWRVNLEVKLSSERATPCLGSVIPVVSQIITDAQLRLWNVGVKLVASKGKVSSRARTWYAFELAPSLCIFINVHQTLEKDGCEHKFGFASVSLCLAQFVR